MEESQSLLSRLKAGTKNSKPIFFPGTETKLIIRVLNCAEIQRAVAETEKRLKELNVTFGMFTADEFDAENTIQTLALALYEPDGKTSFAEDADHLRANLTDAQRTVLLQEYNALQEECSPLLGNMGQEEFSAVLEEVKKKPEETVLRISDTVLLKRLIISLASPPANSPTDS